MRTDGSGRHRRPDRVSALAIGFVLGIAAGGEADVPWVRTSGTAFVAESGTAIQLRGINLGSWLSTEGWILELNHAVPESERVAGDKELWRALEDRFGSAGEDRIRKAHHDTWITRTDFGRIKVAGFNFVRVPFWYGWLQHDESPDRIDPRGWYNLDRAVRWGRELGLWVLLDLHGAPGGSREHPGTAGRSRLFKERSLQDRTVSLWRAIARRYADNPTVLGYDLLNEPGGGTPRRIAALHDRIYRAIRQEDTRHVIVMEDGMHGLKSMPQPRKFGWVNVAYSVHLYVLKARDEGPHVDFARERLPEWRKLQLKLGVPLYVGEFNTINPEWGLSATRRYVEAFESYGWAWSPWTYKKVEAGSPPSLWGLYRNTRPWDAHVDVRGGGEFEVRNSFERMDTAYMELNRSYLEALMGKGER